MTESSSRPEPRHPLPHGVEPLAGHPAAVVLPGPAAVRQLPQVVHEAPAQQVRVAARVELHRPLHELLDRVELSGRRDEVEDPLRRLDADVRSHVDQHQPGDLVRVVRRVGERVERSHRLAHEHGTLEPQVPIERLEVAHVRLRPVVEDRRPLAVAVPPLVEREAVGTGSRRARQTRSQVRAVSPPPWRKSTDGRPPGSPSAPQSRKWSRIPPRTAWCSVGSVTSRPSSPAIAAAARRCSSWSPAASVTCRGLSAGDRCWRSSSARTAGPRAGDRRALARSAVAS